MCACVGKSIASFGLYSISPLLCGSDTDHLLFISFAPFRSVHFLQTGPGTVLVQPGLPFIRSIEIKHESIFFGNVAYCLQSLLKCFLR